MATITLYKCDVCELLYEDSVPSFGASDLGIFKATCQACIGSMSLADLATLCGFVPADPPPTPVEIV